MQKIIQALLLTTLMAGHFCQKIVIDNSTLISPCTTGARSAVDTYLITGTIGDNITMALNQNWETAVYIKVLRRTSPQYKKVCQFSMRIGTCQSYPAIKCVCFYNTTTDQARFTLSDTVQAGDSNAIINVQWQHGNRTIIYSNRNYTFPEIYDVNAAQLNLTVAGVTANLPSGSCSFNLTLNKSNDLELCCSNTAKPCYPQISFNGAVVANNAEMCVTYPASQLASDGVTGNLVLSYSMCNHTDYQQGSICTVISKPDVTNTESSSSSSNMTVSPVPSDDSKCKVICPAVIVPVIVVIIIAVGIAVYCYQAKRRSKGNSQHKKQAYDAKKSIPSDVTINGVNTTTNDNFQQDNAVQEKDSNKSRNNDGSASRTVPRQFPPLKETHTYGLLHPGAVESRHLL